MKRISILNQDYRLSTAILARCLETILPDIINLDQTGFKKTRQTRENIRSTLHVIQNIIRKGLEGVVLGLDTIKVDSVRWDFLYTVLEQFGFHETFIETIHSCNNKPTPRIKINGNLLNSLTLERPFYYFFGTSGPSEKVSNSIGIQNL